ncbi:MAG: hypothetical protein K2I53_12265, partial [Lachnospiraceae bacterium]|nr:hypothetical protein [Lachnospiraceae bacterium]
IDSLKDESTVAEDAPEDNNDIEREPLNQDETISGNEGPTLPPDPEKTPEAPAPSEDPNDTDTPEAPDGSDKPDIPDGSGSTEKPNTPEASDGAETPNTPSIPEGSGGTEEPNAPDISGGAETPDGSDSAGDLSLPGVPDEASATGELNEPEIMDNTMEDSTASYGLLDSEGEVADAIEGRTVALHTASTKNDAVQTAEEQLGIPLWGLAIVLILLTGIVLLTVLREKHN